MFSRFSALIQILHGGHHISNISQFLPVFTNWLWGRNTFISLTRDSETFRPIPCACPMHLAPPVAEFLSLYGFSSSWQCTWMGADSLFCVSKCGLMLKCGLSLTCRSRLTFMHVHYLPAKGHSHHHWEPQEASYRLGCEGVDELCRALKVPMGQ